MPSSNIVSEADKRKSDSQSGTAFNQDTMANMLASKQSSVIAKAGKASMLTEMHPASFVQKNAALAGQDG